MDEEGSGWQKCIKPFDARGGITLKCGCATNPLGVGFILIIIPTPKKNH